MEENKGGWDGERTYTVIQNTTKNSKVVLSMLNGVEIAPGQTVDLRTMFRKSQVADAGHEIFSLIKSGHLRDIGEGAAVRADANRPVADQVADDVRNKMREALLREIGSSSSLSSLEDFLRHKDPEVAKAAKTRLEILMGDLDDEGNVIPGAEEAVNALPTEVGTNLIR